MPLLYKLISNIIFETYDTLYMNISLKFQPYSVPHCEILDLSNYPTLVFQKKSLPNLFVRIIITIFVVIEIQTAQPSLQGL